MKTMVAVLVAIITLATTSGMLVAQVAQNAPEAAIPAALPEASVSGTWEGKLFSALGTAEITFYLKQEGDQVRGTFDAKGPTRSKVGVEVIGTFKGGQLSLTYPSLAFSSIEAKVEGNIMTGTLVGRSSRPQALKATRVK